MTDLAELQRQMEISDATLPYRIRLDRVRRLASVLTDDAAELADLLRSIADYNKVSDK